MGVPDVQTFIIKRRVADNPVQAQRYLKKVVVVALGIILLLVFLVIVGVVPPVSLVLLSLVPLTAGVATFALVFTSKKRDSEQSIFLYDDKIEIDSDASRMVVNFSEIVTYEKYSNRSLVMLILKLKNGETTGVVAGQDDTYQRFVKTFEDKIKGGSIAQDLQIVEKVSFVNSPKFGFVLLAMIVLMVFIIMTLISIKGGNH